jgi:hypothetical protein
VVVDAGGFTGSDVNRKPVQSVALANRDAIQMNESGLVLLTGPTTPELHHFTRIGEKTLASAHPRSFGGAHCHVGRHPRLT